MKYQSMFDVPFYVSQLSLTSRIEGQKTTE
jgi:hypothetical protein